MKKYKRIVLKLSGEAFREKDSTGIISKTILENLAQQVQVLYKDYDLEIAIVVGGGNIFRGKITSSLGLGEDTTRSDYIGMLATSLNALILGLFLEKQGLKVEILNSFAIEKLIGKFNKNLAISVLEKKKEILILGGGTGNPYLSTDTAAALLAKEIKADIIFMAKNNVDGVYSSDPNKDKNAKFFPEISFQEVLDKKLKIIDFEAIEALKGTGIDILIFNMNKRNNIINLYKDSKTKKTIIKEKI